MSTTVLSEHQILDRRNTDLVTSILPLVGNHRFREEVYWKDIAAIIYNVYSGSQAGFELFEKATLSRNLGKSSDAINAMWQNVSANPLTVRTLAWYASNDSPERWAVWREAWTKPILRKALSMTHDEVAEVVYRLFWITYMNVDPCSDVEWYHFYEHSLLNTRNGLDLRLDINDILLVELRRLKSTMNGDAEGSGENEVARLTKLMTLLHNKDFRNSVIAMCREKFAVRDSERYSRKKFSEFANRNPDLIGWWNGVTECCGNIIAFRPGKPEDFLTRHAAAKVIPNMGWNHPQVLKLMIWLGQIFPAMDLLHFFLKDASSYMRAGNPEKLFRVWYGRGNNSKSMLIKLLKATFGKLCIDFPNEMFMKNVRKSSGPTPEIAQADTSLLGIVAEPDKDDELDGGKVKKYTGMDSFFGRKCHQDGGSIELTLKVIYMCNDPPQISNPDEALTNRLCILPFLSTWSASAPDSIEEQYQRCLFKMDKKFDTTIPNYTSAFIWVLMQYYPIYCSEGLNPPQTVIDHTAKYWKDNDPYFKFIQSHLIRDPSSSITHRDIFGQFRIWYNTTQPRNYSYSEDTFATEMTKANRLGPYVDSRWQGWKVAR